MCNTMKNKAIGIKQMGLVLQWPLTSPYAKRDYDVGGGPLGSRAQWKEVTGNIKQIFGSQPPRPVCLCVRACLFMDTVLH